MEPPFAFELLPPPPIFISAISRSFESRLSVRPDGLPEADFCEWTLDSSGGQKDCHAVHVHYALNRLRGWENITGDTSQAATMHYALHLLDLEHYCWRRQAGKLAAAVLAEDRAQARETREREDGSR